MRKGKSRRFLSKSQTQKEGAPEGVALVPGNFTTLSVLTDLARETTLVTGRVSVEVVRAEPGEFLGFGERSACDFAGHSVGATAR